MLRLVWLGLLRARVPLRGLALACLTGVVLAACAPATGPTPPNDPRLNSLFAQLAAAPDAAAARAIEEQIWARWRTSDSPTVDILLERAASAEAVGDRDLAREFLIRAADLAPDLAEPWSRRAALAYDERDYRGAILAIEETLRREPRHFAAYAGLGAIYEEIGEPRAALAAYEAALDIHPHLTVAQQGRARLTAQISGRDG